MKTGYLLLSFLLISFYGIGQNVPADKSSNAYPDSASFCHALMSLMAEANGNFVRLKGNLTDSTGSAMIYTTCRGLPGAITSSIIDDGGLRYEGAMYDGASKSKMEQTYTTYKLMLDGCMLPAGYDNTIEKQRDEKYPYKAYLKPVGGSNSVVLSTEYSDINSFYRVTISVNK